MFSGPRTKESLPVMQRPDNGPRATRPSPQPDHAGLQVVFTPDPTPPEVLPAWQQQQQRQHDQALPEVLPTWEQQQQQQKQEGWRQDPPSYDAGPESLPPPGAPLSPPSEAFPLPSPSVARPWYRRKRWIVAIAIGLVLVIGAVVGGVMGSRTAAKYMPLKHTSSCSTSQLCPQILAAALEESDLGSPYTATLHLFARGSDNAIWRASSPLSSSTPSYTAFTSFLAGSFTSQPAALAWGNGSTGFPRRVGVFAISKSDNNVQMKTVQGKSGDVSGPVIQPIATCLVYDMRPDLWSIFGSEVHHNLGSENPDESEVFWTNMEPGRKWEGDATFKTSLKGGRVGVVCRDDDVYHDLVAYGVDGAVRHLAYNGKGRQWTPDNYGGKFQGEPVVVGVGAKRFDFFGIGEDRAMYHFTWTDGGVSPALENSGGQFSSVPSAAVTGADRIDVVALGMNDMLQHRVMKGSGWVGDWEDLGVFANSAPLLVNVSLQDPAEERIAMFVVGEHGVVNQTMWTVSDELSWKGLVWSGMEGCVTTEFLS